ncbi:MAG: hypothetical protein WC708_06580 [Lentisphaeria bacterium]
MLPFQRLIAAGLLAGLFSLLLCGCGTLDWPEWTGLAKTPGHVIQLYRVAPATDAHRRDVREVQTSTGRPLFIYTQVLLSSVNIASIRNVTLNGRVELELTLDPTGANLWLDLRRNLTGDNLAVMMDGWCRGVFRVAPPVPGETPGILYLPGPWTPQEIPEIIRQAPVNHERLNAL